MKEKTVRQKSKSIIAASQKPNEANGKGVIRVDTGMLQLPKSFINEQKQVSNSVIPHKVVVVIVASALLFIALITFLIWLTPVTPEK